MPQTIPAPAQAPAAPQVATPQIAAPMTRADVRALTEQRSRLSDQLQSASSRRASLVRSLQTAPEGVARTGLEARISVLDNRILQLENELEITGQKLRSDAAARPGITNPARGFDRMNPEVAGPIGVMFVLAVLFPISLAHARRIWRRTTGPAPVAPRESPESAQRLARLEEAVDAIAVEVERISEGQRFMTKIMVGQRTAADVAAAAAAAAEPGSSPRALGAGQAPAETIKVGGKEAVPVANVATPRN